MVNTIEEEGIIDEEASELLHRSIDFKETSCYEVMTPRVRVFGYDTDESFETFLKKKVLFTIPASLFMKGILITFLAIFRLKPFFVNL